VKGWGLKVSHILRPGNTAFKKQLKLVNDSIKGYMRERKKGWGVPLKSPPELLQKG
jgi:hypothetical protein